MRKGTAICICAYTLALEIFSVCAYFAFLACTQGQFRDLKETDHEYVFISKDKGMPGQISVHIQDMSGKPVAGEGVSFTDGIEEAYCVTDRKGAGIARFPSWYNIETIDVGNSIIPLSRDDSIGASGFSVKNGLRVQIILKTKAGLPIRDMLIKRR